MSADINKIRIVLVDPETRNAVTTQFDDFDAAIEFLQTEKANKETDGSQTQS